MWMCASPRGRIVAFLVCPLLAACAAAPEEAEPTAGVQSAIVSENGLAQIFGLDATNGLSPRNGLSTLAGLSGTEGLLTTEEGRATVKYLVHCALPAGRSISKVDQAGISYAFAGGLGIAPEWELGACEAQCQERVSACLMAHVNTSGRHVRLWIVGESPALGWGYNLNYPFQEGAFFGNLFVSPPAAHYCNGRGFNYGTVPGRIGAAKAGSPYRNPFADPGQCQSSCVSSTATHSEVSLFSTFAPARLGQMPRSDGYTSCGSWTRVVTVYRDFDPATDYKVCNASTTLCLGTRGGSAALGTPIDQYAYTGQPGQRFRLTRLAAELTSQVLYSICLPGTTSCVALVNPVSGDVRTSATEGVAWSFVPAGTGYVISRFGGNPRLSVANGSTAEGAPVVASSGTGALWTVLPAD